MAKVGDIVRFLSSTGGGTVVKVDGQIAHVEEDDGFVTPVLMKELVVVSAAGEQAMRKDVFGGTAQKKEADEAERRSKEVKTVVPEAPVQPEAPVAPEASMQPEMPIVPEQPEVLVTAEQPAQLERTANFGPQEKMGPTSME